MEGCVTMLKQKKKAGRPSTVQDGQAFSVLFGKRERRILAQKQRELLETQDNVSRSWVIRHIVRTTDAHAVTQHFQDEAEKAEMRRRIDYLEEDRSRLERLATAATKEKRRGEGHMARLLQFLPWVRERVGQGINLPHGDRLLDQVWYNAGRSWARVQVRLEQLERDITAQKLGDVALQRPVDAGGGAT